MTGIEPGFSGEQGLPGENGVGGNGGQGGQGGSGGLGGSGVAQQSVTVTGESGQTVTGTTNGKEFASGTVATLVAFLGGLVLAISDDKITAVEWVTISLNTVVGAAAGFGITYVVPTRIR